MSSHRSRFRAKLRAAQEGSAGTPARSVFGVSPIGDILNFGGSGGVEAAKWTPNRGQMDRVAFDPSKVLTGAARKTVLNKCRWLALNDGYAKFLVHGLANLIGYYTLQPATKDKAWNKLAEAHWKNRIKSPAVFDRTGKFNHARWQLALSRGSIRDGDILTVLTYAQSGAGQILMYGSHQLDDGAKKADNLRDGIYHDQFYTHTGYNLINAKDDTQSAVIKASDALYYGDFQDPCELRPMPRFTHAVNDLHDIAEIDLDSKLGIKRRQFIGLYKKRARAQFGGPNGLGVYTSPVTEPGPSVTQTNADGTTTTKTTLVSVESVSDRTGIASLDEGEDYGVIQADNPGPNEREFNKTLLSKIALGLGLSPTVVFAILGAGGPEVRFHMAMLQRWLQIELLNLLQIVQSHYFWTIGTDIARGALPAPQGDDEWWNHIAIPCADLTIDRGRELNGKIAALKVGALTHASLHAESGNDWEDQLEIQGEYIAAAARIAAEKGLAGGLSDLMPEWNPTRNPNAPAPPPSTEPMPE